MFIRVLGLFERLLAQWQRVLWVFLASRLRDGPCEFLLARPARGTEVKSCTTARSTGGSLVGPKRYLGASSNVKKRAERQNLDVSATFKGGQIAGRLHQLTGQLVDYSAK